MKIEMKKYIFLLIALFTMTTVWSQSPGDITPPGTCLCCEDFLPSSPDPQDPSSPYQECLTACNNSVDPFTYCDPVVPIDSNILILLVLGTSFGIFKIYQNKKRQFEN